MGRRVRPFIYNTATKGNPAKVCASWPDRLKRGEGGEASDYRGEE